MRATAVRMPASVLEAAHLHLDEVVEVRAEEGKIVIERRQQNMYDLDVLLEAIPSRNLHEAIDFGSSECKEIW